MSAGAASASAGAAAAAAVAQAIKASGSVVRVEPNEFLSLVNRQEEPVVLKSGPGFFGGLQFMTSYKGFCFHCKTSHQLPIPSKAELIVVNKIWVPH